MYMSGIFWLDLSMSVCGLLAIVVAIVLGVLDSRKGRKI